MKHFSIIAICPSTNFFLSNALPAGKNGNLKEFRWACV